MGLYIEHNYAGKNLLSDIMVLCFKIDNHWSDYLGMAMF